MALEGFIGQAQNKSWSLLNIIYKNTQELQLFTRNIKTEIIYKSYKNANAKLQAGDLG